MGEKEGNLALKNKTYVLNRILFVVCTCLLFTGCYFAAAEYAQARAVRAVAEKVLRFHVIAKSDSAQDQRRKLLVRDAVGEWMQLKLSEAENLEACEEVILKNEKQICRIAEEALKKDGKKEHVSVRLADVEFPEKTYGDYRFPAGTYRALQIVIGEGNGHNWWCVLYPNLCFSAEGYDKTGDEAEKELTKVLSASEYEILLKENSYKLDVKYLKWLKFWDD